MAPASKEATRKQRSIALSRLNTALEDFNKSRSRDAIDLDTVRAQIRIANIAYGRFMACHNKFLDSLCEEAAMDEDLVESTIAFKKINTAKAQFLALKRANSGLEPSVPLAEISSQRAEIFATGVDPEKDADDPNLGSASGQAGRRQGGKEGSRRKGRGKRSIGRGNGPGGETLTVVNTSDRKLDACPFPTASTHARNMKRWTSPGGGNSSRRVISAPFACRGLPIHRTRTNV